jgi:hypothetical protein
MGIKEAYLKIFERGPYPIIYTLGILAIVFPLVSPLGLPLPISEQPRILYDWLETNVQPGDKFVLGITMGSPSNYPEYGYLGEAVAIHILEQGGKVIFFASAPATAVPAMNIMIQNLQPQLDASGYVYGKDYMYYGAIGQGDETAWAAFARNPKFQGNDYYGNFLADLDIMQGVNTMADFKAAVCLTNTYIVKSVRQWGEPYNVPLLVGATGCSHSDVMAFFPAFVKCGINSMMGSAEYMILKGDHRFPVKSVDVLSLLMIYAICVIVTGNISGQWKKITGGGN